MRDDALIAAEKVVLAAAEAVALKSSSTTATEEILHEMISAVVIKAHQEGIPYRTLIATATREAESWITGIDEEE